MFQLPVFWRKSRRTLGIDDPSNYFFYFFFRKVQLSETESDPLELHMFDGSSKKTQRNEFMGL